MLWYYSQIIAQEWLPRVALRDNLIAVWKFEAKTPTSKACVLVLWTFDPSLILFVTFTSAIIHAPCWQFGKSCRYMNIYPYLHSKCTSELLFFAYINIAFLILHFVYSTMHTFELLIYWGDTDSQEYRCFIILGGSMLSHYSEKWQ